MASSIISALSALLGAAVGGLASFFASWMTQRMQMRAQWLGQEKLRRQDLYKEFVEEAAKCYIDALQHDKGDIPSLVMLYTKIDRMRVLSQPKVIDSAEKIMQKILNTYLEPDRSFVELRTMASNNSLDIMHDFTTACREEFESLHRGQL
ncbi:MAG: hypothetical protein JO283_08550 [Bradyrhizobium sp.]|nr:hypothetical protein [Bradyrhizobium sp.]